ncbi:MAG TPA: hypothetical protein VHB02_06125 [Acidimicrobiales bacterium]|nr:hypothetical protein [Acidimicrobiales bacterium]
MVDHDRPITPYEVLDELHTSLEQISAGAVIPQYDQLGNEIAPKHTPGLSDLWDLLSAARRDGYRTRSMGGGTAATIYDDDGHAMPPLADPVGELVVDDRKVRDPMVDHVTTLMRSLTHALGDVRIARASFIRAWEEHGEPGTGEPACRVHARIGIFEEVHRSDRCRWCYDFYGNHGVDPPRDLVRARADGKKITQRMIDEALRPPARAGKRGKGKKGGKRQKVA